MRPQNPGDPDNAERARATKRVQERQARGVATLSPEDLAGLTADLIRLHRE